MEAQHVPPNYTGVHYNQVLGVPIQFCFRAEVDNHPVNIVQNASGVSLKYLSGHELRTEIGADSQHDLVLLSVLRGLGG